MKRHDITSIADLSDVTTPETVEEMKQNVAQWLDMVAEAKRSLPKEAWHAFKTEKITWVEDGIQGVSAAHLRVTHDRREHGPINNTETE